jgi:hypothetical protein
MIASCYRRMLNYEKALSLYEALHQIDPENHESLKFIVQINLELGHPCDAYQIKLKNLEREMETNEGAYVDFETDKMDQRY